MITLYLARHGQTEENIARIFQGHMPGTLTVEGIAQAEALRDTLRNISLDAVVSSDLKRCVDTCLLYTSCICPMVRKVNSTVLPSMLPEGSSIFSLVIAFFTSTGVIPYPAILVGSSHRRME